MSLTKKFFHKDDNINKENVHNHIILNSVSFTDGYKYHNSKAQIAFLKETSDRLCLNYVLSIVDTPKANKERIYGYIKENLPPVANYKKNIIKKHILVHR